MTDAAIRYQPLTPDLAEALVDCVRAVYDEHYSLPEFYDAQKVRDLLERGLLHAFVGLDAQGAIVATLGAQLEAADAITIDGRTGMVRSEYRQHGALKDLGDRMFAIYGSPQVHGIQMYAVMFHTISQRHGLAHGCFVTGLLPAHFPPQMVPPEYPRFVGRVGALSMYRPMQPLPPAQVCLPAPYRQVIRELYAAQGVPRTEIPRNPHPVAPATRFKFLYDERTDAGSAQLTSIGADFAAALDVMVAEAQRRGSAVVYLDIPLADPACTLAVDLANQRGFFFGALLLARKAGDILRLQKLLVPNAIVPGETKVYADDKSEVQRMLDFVLADARRVGGL